MIDEFSTMGMTEYVSSEYKDENGFEGHVVIGLGPEEDEKDGSYLSIGVGEEGRFASIEFENTPEDVEVVKKAIMLMAKWVTEKESGGKEE